MLTIAPRVVVYPCGQPVPRVAEGWITLAQIASSDFVFGDGSHPTTRLCAGAVDLTCRLRQPEAVLDVGTGTGVLARIARARGARFVVGTDIDPLALANARANCALDGVDIEVSGESPDHWPRRFDLVVANILEAPLRALANSIAVALKPSGTLLLSGFTRLQLPALRLAYENVGLTYVRHSELDEWSLLMLSA
jgi:ribosomal protein L11 methyltransferase